MRRARGPTRPRICGCARSGAPAGGGGAHDVPLLSAASRRACCYLGCLRCVATSCVTLRPHGLDVLPAFGASLALCGVELGRVVLAELDEPRHDRPAHGVAVAAVLPGERVQALARPPPADDLVPVTRRDLRGVAVHVALGDELPAISSARSRSTLPKEVTHGVLAHCSIVARCPGRPRGSWLDQAVLARRRQSRTVAGAIGRLIFERCAASSIVFFTRARKYSHARVADVCRQLFGTPRRWGRSPTASASGLERAVVAGDAARPGASSAIGTSALRLRVSDVRHDEIRSTQRFGDLLERLRPHSSARLDAVER